MAPTLKDHRTALGLSQRDLGQRLGISHSQIAAWERGIERVPPTHRATILATLGVEAIEWNVPRIPRKSARPVPLRVLFTVRGSTGLKDDRQEWSVGDPIPTLEHAQKIAMRLNTWCIVRHLYADGDRIASWCERESAVCPHDAGFTCDFTGTRYEVVPVLVSVPRAK